MSSFGKGGDEPPSFYWRAKGGKMEIVYKKIGELIPYENNPRKNDEAVYAVAASISEFGWKVPVVIDILLSGSHSILLC